MTPDKTKVTMTTIDRPKRNLEHRSVDDEGTTPEEVQDVTTIPYYGGAKGSVLKVGRKSDGSVVTQTVTQSPKVEDPSTTDFTNNLFYIQQAAAVLVALQQRVKMTGKLTGADKKIYADHLQLLGVSAQKLAQLQNEAGDNDLNLLFQGPENDQKNVTPTKETEGDFDSIAEEQQPVEQPLEVQPSNPDDGVSVSAPPADAPVAEAKPIGLAIAGVGGLASSKPIGTAVVNKDGLAVARPVATAIAGITPEQFAQLSIPVPQKGNFGTSPIKDHTTGFSSFLTKYGLVSLDDGVSLLVGPGFQPESRFSDKDIDADEGDKKTVIDLESDTLKTFDKFKNLAEAPKELIPNQYPLIPPRLEPLGYRFHGPSYPEHVENFPGVPYLPPSEQYNSGSLPYPFLPVYNPYHQYN
ncbi:hypothetical protein DMENIID0001_163610 [Sergentomyia squamirostris]